MAWSLHAIVFTVVFLLGDDGAIYFGSCASTTTHARDIFTIQHVVKGTCVGVKADSLQLVNCSSGLAVQWKWGSDQLLFHVGTSRCLGLEVQSKRLRLLGCDSKGKLAWRCHEGAIYTMYQMRLSVSGDAVTAKRETADVWRRGGTSENICQQPYRTIHTTEGNAYGAPCQFPFLYNGTWHHSCLPSNDTASSGWCSTTSSYDRDQKWGTCLNYVDGCGDLWVGYWNSHCYQTVSMASVTWHEARDSCRSQGGDLLSVSSAQELQHISRAKLPEKLWIGLNQLDLEQGWQWSDGSALSYVPWDSAIPLWSVLSETDCGVLNSELRFETEICERKLPYICEKKENSTQMEPTARMVYKSTVCEDGWTPWQGFCFKLFGDEKTTRQPQPAAERECVSHDAHLASIRTLEDVEMLNTHFHSEDGGPEVWLGLRADGNSAAFQWEDDSPVSFSYWARSQPPLLLPNSTNCVSYMGKLHLWQVSGCESALPFLCKKEGKVNESTAAEGCPPDGEWRRHGNACYQVNMTQVSFKETCELTIMNRFEQTFINSLLKEHISSEPQYFWTLLQDIKGTGEYQWFSPNGRRDTVTFTNWGWPEPVGVGGCVVLSTASPLGHWEVKNCTLFKAASICKIPIGPKEPAKPEPDRNASCPSGWFSGPGNPYCYKVFHEERLSRKRSWLEAERFCEALGAHLPSFMEPEEMKALHNVMRETISDDRYFWVGLNRRNPNNHNTWEWSDGRPVSMSIFPQEFHEDDDYNRDCTAFKSLKGTFKLLFFFLLHDVPPRPFYASPFHCDAALEWVCQIPRGHTPLAPEWYNPDGHHETSVFVDSQEFWFVTNPSLPYEEARLYCASNQSKLATPLTINAARQLQEHLYKNTGDKVKNWWADLSEPGLPPNMVFSNMRHYHSAFLGRCTAISRDSIMPDYQNSCYQPLPFVCERLNITSAEKHPAEPHPNSQPCERNTFAFRDKCYRVIAPKLLPFKRANEECHSLRGSLLTIANQVEQDFITTLLPGQPQKVWIGLKLKFHETQWVDSSSVTYLNFNPLLHGQFRPIRINLYDQESLEMCTYMFNEANSAMMGTWDYTVCSDLQFVSVCQYYADKPEVPEVSEAPFQANNHTFQLLLGQNLTWLDALDACHKQGMDLASVADAYLQAVLSVRVSRAGRPMWIGLYSEEEGDHYHWTDNSHTIFSRWSDQVYGGRCVYLDVDGFWKATDCEEQLSGAICHTPHEETIARYDDVKCPHTSNGPNWIPFKNNCYSIQLVSSRWDWYKDGYDHSTCTKLVGRGRVLAIRNEAENKFVRQQLEPFRDLAKFVWLGIYKNNSDNQLRWHDDTIVQYSNWKNGRPNITGPFMAGLNLEGNWELVTNDRLFIPFKHRSIVVCKIENDSKEEFQRRAIDVQPSGDKRYRLVAKKLTWFQALKECSHGGGHLASVHDEDKDAIRLIAKRDGFPLWIGLSKQEASGWPYEWSDGTSLDYRPLDFVDSEADETCAYVDPSGTWRATNCHIELEGAICYSSTNPKSSAQSSPRSSTCPETEGLSQWVHFKDHCYSFNMTFYNYSVFTMEDAKSVCQTLDSSAQLLSIKSKEENEFVWQHMAENPLITSRAWLGLELDISGEPVSWLDGSGLDFSNWASDSAGRTQAAPVCAVLASVSQGTWHRINCTNSRSRIVCKVPARSGGAPVALALFLVVLFSVIAAAFFLIYKKNRGRFSSTIRYQRNFDEADSTSMMTEME